MAYIQQGSCPVSDNNLITVSMWFIAPTQDSLLFSVTRPDGARHAFQLYYSSGGADPSYDPNLYFSAGSGKKTIFAATANIPNLNGMTWPFGDAGDPPNSGSQQTAWGSFGNFSSDPPLPVNVGGWNHLLVALDCAHDGPNKGGSFSSNDKIGYIYLNAQYVNTLPTDLLHVRTSPTTDGGGFNGWSDSYLSSWAGYTVGLPGTGPDRAFSPVAADIKYGDIQVWVGTFINPTFSSNYAKFVSISGGIGTPVNPAIAASAFGQQTFLFHGDHTQFHINLGSGGAFSKVGTISDFTPTPSF